MDVIWLVWDIFFKKCEQKHQPIILQREMLYWKEFNNLIGDSLLNIKIMISKNSTTKYSDYIKNNIDINYKF